MNQNKDESAFPFVWTQDAEHVSVGLTKREYIATQIASGLAVGEYFSKEVLAINAVKIADALLKELEKPTGAEVGNE